MMVVNVPAPANSGNAIGTILPDCSFPSVSGSSLKILTFKIISNPMKNMINEPAMANDEVSIPNTPKIELPKNRNKIIINAEISVTTVSLNFKPSFFMPMIIGTLPIMSITEKRITVTEKIAAIIFTSCVCNLNAKLAQKTQL